MPQQHEHSVGELDDLCAPVNVESALEVGVGLSGVDGARLPEAEEEEEGAVDVDAADDEVVHDQDLQVGSELQHNKHSHILFLTHVCTERPERVCSFC